MVVFIVAKLSILFFTSKLFLSNFVIVYFIVIKKRCVGTMITFFMYLCAYKYVSTLILFLFEYP